MDGYGDNGNSDLADDVEDGDDDENKVLGLPRGRRSQCFRSNSSD